VYAISVAAELSGAPIQSIRLWERHGLLTALVTAGVNIAGITRILDLEDDNTALRTARSPGR
jgi:DNA-binding transcriptional MerR regulator